MTITNSVVANAIKARTVRNSVEVEISPGYAARVQYAMRDAVRGVSGVRMTSTNTLECRDEDAADEVIDILKQAGVPAGEVWTNANVMANATYKLSSTEAKVGDKVRVAGALGTYVVTKVDGEWIEIKDADDGTPQGRVKARFATPVKNACGTAKNAEASQKLRNAWHSAFDALKGLYAAAKAEGHSAVADAANKAVKTLMDNTKDLGFS